MKMRFSPFSQLRSFLLLLEDKGQVYFLCKKEFDMKPLYISQKKSSILQWHAKMAVASLINVANRGLLEHERGYSMVIIPPFESGNLSPIEAVIIKTRLLNVVCML